MATKAFPLKTRVVTDDDFYKAIKEKEEDEPKKGGIRKRGRPSKNAVQGGAECNISAGKRRRTESNIANDEAISDDSTDSNDSQSDSKETNNGKEVGEIQKEQKGQESAGKNRGNIEESLAMEISLITEHMDDDKKGLFYCVYYGDQFYWGKVQKTFAQNPDDNADTVEMNFLRYRGDGFWDFPKMQDVEIVDVKYLFLGPCQPLQMVSGKGYKFEEDSAAHSRFSTIREHDFYGC